MDAEKEKGRLAAVYSRMSDGELQRIAQDANSLTDAALQTLKSEAGRRGFNIPIQPVPPASDVLERRELVTVRKFRDLPEAFLAKGLLGSAGIEAVLMDENMVRLDWFISNLLGGVKLQVKPEDVIAATDILEQPIPDQFEFDDGEEYQQPGCPNCQSLDVTFEELNRPVAYASAWLGVPIPVHQKGWQCKSCGCRWDDALSQDAETD